MGRATAPARRRAWALAVAALFALCSLAAQAAPRIGVATMQPGEIFFERFGHNAIVVDDPALPEPVSYNYGYFDLDEPGFVGNFVRGEMTYMLVALPLSQDLAYYRDVGRGVSIQWLALDDAEAAALAAALAENARPENARYRYDYFTDNCSTRVRDALDEALGGLLRRQLQGRSRGNTYRGEAVRLASPAPWMWLGFDIGLGPRSDRPNALWEDAFVPMRLADALRGLRRADGRALVSAEAELLPHRLAPEPPEAPRPWWPWGVAGVALAAAIAWGARRAPRATAAAGLAFWSLCALLGAAMLFIWLFTAHRFGWGNQNLLLFDPLCALLLPGGWRLLRGRAPGRLFGWTLAAVAVAAAIALFLHWLPVQPQRNAHWIALLLPLHLAWLWALRGRRDRAA
ncbi:DUF4105 domain-containing protein [Luteimonas huabeiensis]|uniref:lipoprotein N-acyltransferase Lnb domain-containing protein n=1 Tax=Luteimonas huabeiensis TaxID=1244513 RepID=UPI0004659021|nr:DUF4105 domain-containing protein [Luteimonas huabeiensis]